MTNPIKNVNKGSGEENGVNKPAKKQMFVFFFRLAIQIYVHRDNKTAAAWAATHG